MNQEPEVQVIVEGKIFSGLIKPPREFFISTEDLLAAGVERLTMKSSLGLKSITGTVYLGVKGYWLKY